MGGKAGRSSLVLESLAAGEENTAAKIAVLLRLKTHLQRYGDSAGAGKADEKITEAPRLSDPTPGEDTLMAWMMVAQQWRSDGRQDEAEALSKRATEALRLRVSRPYPHGRRRGIPERRDRTICRQAGFQASYRRRTSKSFHAGQGTHPFPPSPGGGRSPRKNAGHRRPAAGHRRVGALQPFDRRGGRIHFHQPAGQDDRLGRAVFGFGKAKSISRRSLAPLVAATSGCVL